GDGVKGGGGLLQYQERAVVIQGAGEHQPLGLPARQLYAVQIDLLAQVGVIALGQGSDLFGQDRLGNAGFHFVHVDAVHPLGHCLGNGDVQLGTLLKDGGEQLVISPAVELPDVLPIQKTPALVGVVEAAQQLDQ